MIGSTGLGLVEEPISGSQMIKALLNGRWIVPQHWLWRDTFYPDQYHGSAIALIHNYRRKPDTKTKPSTLSVCQLIVLEPVVRPGSVEVEVEIKTPWAQDSTVPWIFMPESGYPIVSKSSISELKIRWVYNRPVNPLPDEIPVAMRHESLTKLIASADHILPLARNPMTSNPLFKAAHVFPRFGDLMGFEFQKREVVPDMPSKLSVAKMFI